MNQKLILTLIFLLLVFVVALFWYQEWQYLIPTKKPKNYMNVEKGKKINWKDLPKNTKNTFLHFYNPDCPCSQFNLEHLNSIYKKYQNEVNFIAVLQVDKEIYQNEKKIPYRLSMDYIVDWNGKLADSCGIYATPQAVILDKQQKIYYKGNYNIARYCSQKETEFARIALESILQNKKLPLFSLIAEKSYGCVLPSDEE